MGNAAPARERAAKLGAEAGLYQPSQREVTYRQNRAQSDQLRSKIKTSEILKRLQDHVDGKVELTSDQVRSADILLRKTMSDAPKIIAGDIDQPLAAFQRVVVEVVEAGEVRATVCEPVISLPHPVAILP